MSKKGNDVLLVVLCANEDGDTTQLVMGESNDRDSFAGAQRGSGHGLTYQRFEWKVVL